MEAVGDRRDPSVSASTETGPIARWVGSLISSALEPRKRRPRSTDQSKPTAKSASSLTGREDGAEEAVGLGEVDGELAALQVAADPEVAGGRPGGGVPGELGGGEQADALRPHPDAAGDGEQGELVAGRGEPGDPDPGPALERRSTAAPQISPGGRSSIASPPATVGVEPGVEPRGAARARRPCDQPPGKRRASA